MKLTPKMWLEVALYVLPGLLINGLISTIFVCLFVPAPATQVMGVMAGLIIWGSFLLVVGYVTVRNTYHNDIFDAVDVSYQSIPFRKQEVVDTINHLQLLGFHRLGEIMMGTQALKMPMWYLLDRSTSTVGVVNRLGKVSFVTYFSDGGVVQSANYWLPQINVENYRVTSVRSGTLEDLLDLHHSDVDAHQARYGFPLNVNSMPDVFEASQQALQSHQAHIRIIDRRIISRWLVIASVMMSIPMTVVVLVFGRDMEISLISIISLLLAVTIVFAGIWRLYKYIPRYLENRRHKGKHTQANEQSDDPLYLATVAYYSNSPTEL